MAFCEESQQEARILASSHMVSRDRHNLSRHLFIAQRIGDKGVTAMTVFSKVLVCVFAGALIAGCNSAPYRSGKGNDHLVMYRPANVEETKQTKVDVVPVQREVVYVQQPQVVYQPAPQVVYQPAPTYRVVSSRPEYTNVTTRPTYRYVPVTRYYYD
jgi:hypothetical protein